MTLDVSTAQSITLNGSDVSKITEGSVVLWEKKTPITSPLRVVNNVAGSQITFTLTRNGSPADIFIEYSTDNVNWNTWTETNGVRSMSIAKNGNLFLRGSNPNGINPMNNNTDYYSFNADKQYAMAGDIRSLISHYEIDTLPYCAFGRLFKNSTTLYATGYMRLLATNLSRDCYSNMFYGCSGLRNAPHVLPAISTSRGAYNYMFYGCTSLTTMPIIRTTDFGMQCCYDMFRGCSALANQWTSETPSIETTTTAISFTIASSDERSFYEMFRGCTSLVNASGITATQYTNWNSDVLNSMFYGCAALTSAPSITIGSLAGNSSGHCNAMFYGCSSLVSTPNILLNAPNIYNATYKQMFRGCTELTTAPEIMAETLTDGSGNTDNCSLAFMFYGCSKLNAITVHFTDWNSGAYTKGWTYGTKSTGTFYKPSSLPSTKNTSGNTTNPHYIPYNWTVTEFDRLQMTITKETNKYTDVTDGKKHFWVRFLFRSSDVTGCTFRYNYQIARDVNIDNIDEPTASTPTFVTSNSGENWAYITFDNTTGYEVGIKVKAFKDGYVESNVKWSIVEEYYES